MQKQVNFFEQNVQWIALGLGALFLLYMGYAYVLKQPVVETVDGKQLGPGEIEKETLDVPVRALQADIGKKTLPDIPIIDYVDTFVATIEGVKPQQIASLSPYQLRSIPSEGIEAAGTDTRIVGGPPVESLPKLPAARPGSKLDGRSTVVYEDPNFVPRRPTDVPPEIKADKDWISILFTINGAALAKSFTDAFDRDKLEDSGLDPEAVDAIFETAFVDVQLIRQEVLPGGKLGKEEVVKPLLINKRPPFPGKNAEDPEVQNYLNYVTQTPDDLLKPLFYIVESGDPWLPPSEKTDQLLAANRAQARAQMKMEAEQRRAAMLQQREAMKQQQASRTRARSPVGFEGEMGGEADMDQEVYVPDRLVPGSNRPVYTPPTAPGVRRAQGGRPAAPLAPNTPAVIGPGRFKVYEDMGNIEIIAHDDAVQPGKTYRYKLRYRVLNPVWKSVQAAKPELTKDFAINAPDSGWSQNVKIREKVEFFLAGITLDKAQFDIFYWEKGQMRKDRIEATPGDPIGKTGWTLVDVRGRGRSSSALLMDDDIGRVVPREPEKDNNKSDRYQELELESSLEAVSASQ